MSTLDLAGGFDAPVFQAQTAFRAMMDGLANPGTVQTLGFGLTPPAPLTPELAAIALTLCDHDSVVWLDGDLSASSDVTGWLAFHTGAPVSARSDEAAFALVGAGETLPTLDSFALGTDQYPDRSTTIVLQIESLTGGPALTLRGPGIESTISVSPKGLPHDFIEQWGDNRALFPRGIDLVLVAGEQVLCLPRSTRIAGEI